MLKKVFLSLVLGVALSSAVAGPTFAISTRQGLSDAGTLGGYNAQQGIPELVGGIVSTILALLGVVFLCLTVYAGFTWMTAAGDEKKIAKAKAVLQAAVFGMVIMLSGFAIARFVSRELENATQRQAVHSTAA